jgi:hypothetical protein
MPLLSGCICGESDANEALESAELETARALYQENLDEFTGFK